MRKGRSKRKVRSTRPAASKQSAAVAEALVTTESRPSIPEPEPEPVLRSEAPGTIPEAAQLARAIGSELAPPPKLGPRLDELSSVEPMVTTVRAPAMPEPKESVFVPPTPDEISVPPVGDLGPADEKFFSEGDLSSHVPPEPHHEEEWADAKRLSKHAPHVIQRRERFSRYVRWAVAGAAVVCLAAAGRTQLTGRHAPADERIATRAAMAVASPEPAALKEAPPVAATAKPPEPPAVTEAPKPAEPAPAAAAEAAKAAEPTEAKSAKEEKLASRRALEHGKLGDAIAAGERSVAADAEDGEAWLVLGAAYQEKGKLAEARRCYTGCVKQGKRGPIGECAAMLR